MRLAVLLAAVPCLALSQAPDIRVRGDVTASLVSTNQIPLRPRLYSTLGRHSTVAISAFLENGFNVTLSQRGQVFIDDADDELLDEYFIEDPGIWRVGKQYLPFGSGTLLRESVRAVRADTNLIFEGVPVVVAAFDGGIGRPRGVMGRLGPRAYGFSASVGQYIGVSGTALSIIRRPEGSPGSGRGWGQAFGTDFSYRVGDDLFRAELLVLRDGETSRDENRTILDLTFSRDLGKRNLFVAQTLQDIERGQNFVRLSGLFETNSNVFLEPALILRQGGFDRIALGVRFRF